MKENQMRMLVVVLLCGLTVLVSCEETYVRKPNMPLGYVPGANQVGQKDTLDSLGRMSHVVKPRLRSDDLDTSSGTTSEYRPTDYVPTAEMINHYINKTLAGPVDTCAKYNLHATLAFSQREDDKCKVEEGDEYQVIQIADIQYAFKMSISVGVFLRDCVPHIGAKPEEVTEIEKNLVMTAAELAIKNDFSNYSNSIEVQKLIEKARVNTRTCLRSKNARFCKGGVRGVKHPEKSTAYCLAHVKDTLIQSGFIPAPNGVALAKNFGPTLKSSGFQNLLDDPKYKDMTPRHAPIGAILVYTGGEAGHIEIKGGQDEYISDYNANVPRDENFTPNDPNVRGVRGSPSSRRLIGVYVK